MKVIYFKFQNYNINVRNYIVEFITREEFQFTEYKNLIWEYEIR